MMGSIRFLFLAFFFVMVPGKLAAQPTDTSYAYFSIVPSLFIPIAHSDNFSQPVWTAGIRYTLGSFKYQPAIETGLAITSNRDKERTRPGFYISLGASHKLTRSFFVSGSATYYWMKFEKEWISIDPVNGNTTISHDKSVHNRFYVGPQMSYLLNPDGYPKFNLIAGIGWTFAGTSIDYRDPDTDYTSTDKSGFATVTLSLLISYQN